MADKNSTAKGPLDFENLKPEELIRGATPDDIKSRCLSLCQAYLAGSWLSASEADITVTRITGGLTNQIYRAQLSNSKPEVEDLCTDVAIKLYQSKLLDNFDKADGERFNDTIILTMLSELDIHPKVYGIFADGVVTEFVEHVIFGVEHQNQPELLRTVAHLLARVHSLQVPVKKGFESQVSAIGRHLELAYEDGRMKLVEELNLQTLASVDLKKESLDLIDILTKANIKIVFCHCDFRGSNILVCKKDGRIVITDLEYSSYGFRGFDFALFLFGWDAKSQINLASPELPDDEISKSFIRLYIEGSEKLTPGYLKNPQNSVEAILREVKLGALHLLFYILIMSISRKSSLVETMPFDVKETMKYCDTAFARYLAYKKKLHQEGIF